MDQPSDGALLAALRRGEGSALTELVERHQGALLRHARALLGEGGPFEDAVQEAFLRLLERPPELPEEVRGDPGRERAQLRSWLHKVARNCCMDTIRAEARRKGREHEVAAPESVRGHRAGGAGLAEERDTREAVERGLSRLPHEQREVLVLRLIGERSYKEIAEITGKKVGTVGWLVSVGLKSLGEHLAPLLEISAPALAREPGSRAGRAQS
jgi:RNA polymerase sigma-70 factor (ECF subfamily)